METENIVRIELEKIEPHPGNRMVGGFDQSELQQLADSIKDVGVLQPIIVREKKGLPVLGVPDYELVAGERRWRAAALAGKTDIPCVIRELDDVQVLKTQIIENLQRKDIHPLDEADGYQRLIETAGYTIEQVAAELGKSASYVYQRIKLRELIPEVRKLLVDGKITAGHAILIARLAPDQQQEVGKRVLSGRRDEVVSVRDLAEWIQSYIFMDLSHAVWKCDDAELLPAAGACAACLKRTGAQPDLFADVCTESKRDNCLDRKCFERKKQAMVERRREELRDIKHLEVCAGGVYTGEEKPAGAIAYCEWTECKKNDKGAQRALIVQGDGKGRMTYGKKGSPYSSGSSRSHETAEERRAREAKREKERLENQKQVHIRTAIYKELVARVEKKLQGLKKDFLPQAFLQLLVKEKIEYTVLDDSEFLKAEGIASEKEILAAIKKKASNELLLILIKLAYADDINRTYSGLEHLVAGARAVGVDVKKVTAAAIVEFRKQKATATVRRCRVCGCTDDDCRQCIEKTGEPCHWVEEDLCSACVDAAKKKKG